MKTATVRELRNHYSGLMKWIEAGEEVRITRRGKPVARLVPEAEASPQSLDWRRSPVLSRDREGSERIPAETSKKLLHDSAGKW